MQDRISNKSMCALLAVSFFVEAAFLTFWLGKIGVYAQPILYLGLALLNLFFMWYFSRFGEVKKLRIDVHDNKRQKTGIDVAVFLLIIILIFDFKNILSQFLIDPKSSDVLPAIQLYVQRILNGTWAYAPMDFPGWTVIPNYLPLVWLPFVVPELLGIDYRWLGLAVFTLLAISHQLLYLKKQNVTSWEYALNALLPFVLILLLTRYEKSIIGHTVELLIVSYYLILSRSIMSPKLWWAALGILLCFMSRYSFGLWLPLYGLILSMVYGFSKGFTLAGWVIFGVVVVYIIPFVFEDPMVFFKGMSYYDHSALGEWMPHGWQVNGERPFHLGRGVGFAVYFYDFMDGEIQERIRALQVWNGLTTVGITAIIFAIYYRNRYRIRHLKLFLIFALKIYLMVFYHFIHVPYVYLHILPLMLIIPIVYQLDFGRMLTKAIK